MVSYRFFENHTKDRTELYRLQVETLLDIADKLPYCQTYIVKLSVILYAVQSILHIVHTRWTCTCISFNFLRKTYTFCMEGLYIFHGTAAHILWRNYTFSVEMLPIFYRIVIHFVRKGCIFSTENLVHIRFYGSVMHLLWHSYKFSKEALHIFYGTRVSLTGHHRILCCTKLSGLFA